jgi:hypothetical protein
VNFSAYRYFRSWVVLAAVLLLLAFAGCTSRGRGSSESKESGGARQPAAGNGETEFVGGDYCMETIMQAPPGAPVHFAYQVNDSDGSSKSFDGELAGDTLDVTTHERRPATDFDREMASVPGAKPPVINQGFVESSRTSHYQRSDPSGWAEARLLVHGATPWTLFVLKPSSKKVGDDSVSGYPAIRYAIDTTHESALEKSPGDIGWAVKDYNITGSAWLMKDSGCILQYDIDLEKDGKDGKVSKTHYEGRTTKG